MFHSEMGLELSLNTLPQISRKIILNTIKYEALFIEGVDKHPFYATPTQICHTTLNVSHSDTFMGIITSVCFEMGQVILLKESKYAAKVIEH